METLDLSSSVKRSLEATKVEYARLGFSGLRVSGASSMWATQFASLQFVAEWIGWTKFVSMQNYYHLCYREEEREMNRFCKATGVGSIPWSPLFGGQLARPLGEHTSERSKMPTPFGLGLTPADEEIIRRIGEVAQKRGWNMSHVGLAWLRSKGAIPITGINSLRRADDAVTLRGKVLTEEEIAFFEEPLCAKVGRGTFIRKYCNEL